MLGLRASLSAFALGLALAGAANGQTLFYDSFNGSNINNNNGAGAVNPGSNTVAFQSGGGSGTLTQGSGGAQFAPGGGYGNQWMTTFTGNNSNGQAYTLTPTGIDFSFTVDNVNVTANGGDNRPDIPGSANGGFRFELGIVSANASYGDPEVYNNGSGGIYINLFYDQQGNLTGSVRATDSSKSGQYDSSGSQGIFELATFTIPQALGTTTSYTDPLTATFDLTSTGYTIDFSEPVDVSSGSLTGTYAGVSSLLAGDFANGARANILGQGWSNGDGSGDISDVDFAVAPEPPVVWLLGLGAMALVFFGFRRTVGA